MTTFTTLKTHFDSNRGPRYLSACGVVEACSAQAVDPSLQPEP
jgi:hypothetical protein